MKKGESKKINPPQKQESQPGREKAMTPKPNAEVPHQSGTGKLQGKVAIITGGDSGIGRAAAIAFAKEGANLAILYLNEHDDANETRRLIEAEGRRCLLIPGDVGDESHCNKAVAKIIKEFGR